MDLHITLFVGCWLTRSSFDHHLIATEQLQKPLHKSQLKRVRSTTIKKINKSPLDLCVAIRGGATVAPQIAGKMVTRSNGRMSIDSQRASNMQQTALNVLHQISFLIVLSTSIVAFSPLPSLTRHITHLDSVASTSPQLVAVKILSLLSAISASVELFLSPLIGVWIDTLGRKGPSVVLCSLIALTNLGVVLNPSVGSICVSRVTNVVFGGFLTIVANAFIADISTAMITNVSGSSNSNNISNGNDPHEKDQMGAILGKQAAYLSLGFLSGTLIGGTLTERSDRIAYGCSLLFSVLAVFNAYFRMIDSMDLKPKTKSAHLHSWRNASIKQKLLEAPLSSVQLLFSYGSKMRVLALLLLLQSAPMYMGDVFQMFAKEYWGLTPKGFGGMIALFGILGILSNLSLPLLLRSIDLRNFSLLAIISSLLFPLAALLTDDYRLALLAGCIGFYSGAQKIGTSTVMTTLATELGIPQGQLQGEKASMLALFRIVCPAIYGALYGIGKEWSLVGDDAGGVDGKLITSRLLYFFHSTMRRIGTTLPLVLNVVFGLIAFTITWMSF